MEIFIEFTIPKIYLGSNKTLKFGLNVFQDYGGSNSATEIYFLLSDQRTFEVGIDRSKSETLGSTSSEKGPFISNNIS